MPAVLTVVSGIKRTNMVNSSLFMFYTIKHSKAQNGSRPAESGCTKTNCFKKLQQWEVTRLSSTEPGGWDSTWQVAVDFTMWCDQCLAVIQLVQWVTNCQLVKMKGTVGVCQGRADRTPLTSTTETLTILTSWQQVTWDKKHHDELMTVWQLV